MNGLRVEEIFNNNSCLEINKPIPEENEFEKDIWDIRNIPVMNQSNPSKSHFKIDFTRLKNPYREIVKKYMKVKCNGLSVKYMKDIVKAIEILVEFMTLHRKNWVDFIELKRVDIEEFIPFYLEKVKHLTDSHRRHWKAIYNFIYFIQISGFKEAPKEDINKLIYQEDTPKRKYNYIRNHSPESIKYIPDIIAEQFDKHIMEFKPLDTRNILYLLRATGWRFSDITNLEYDNCLEKGESGWFLKGKCSKVNKYNMIPIDDNTLKVINSQINFIKQNLSEEENPKKYLFANLEKSKKGIPPNSDTITAALNKFSKTFKIVNEFNEYYFIKLHSFRHTKGIELINNGMDLLHVQKWLGHASPYTTLLYSKVKDTSIKNEWDKIKDKLYNIDSSFEKINKLNHENQSINWEFIKNNIEAIKIPLGYCFKNEKLSCSNELNSCLSCSNMCITTDFIEEFEIEILETKSQIERAVILKRDLWLEKNKKYLEKLNKILEVLKENKTYHEIGKSNREYSQD